MAIIKDINNKKISIKTIMICKICGVNETDNPDGICDDCKMAMISDKDIPPNL